jgi:hypothetical protein
VRLGIKNYWLKPLNIRSWIKLNPKLSSILMSTELHLEAIFLMPLARDTLFLLEQRDLKKRYRVSKLYLSQFYEELVVPPVQHGNDYKETRLITIEELDNLCQGTFQGYKTLNRIQSLVYPVAYNTNENMLICAPTGAVRFSLLSH